MTNADPYELKKFSDLAHRWWDPHAEFKLLHALNPLRLNWIDAQANLAGKRVLDVGCGGGLLCEPMTRLGAHVKGIDLSSQGLSVAHLHSLDSGLSIDYEAVSAEALAAREPNCYDVVTCLEMLEHVPDPLPIVSACAALTRPGGWIFFSTLNRNLKSYLLAIIGAEYLAGMLPRGTHDYARFLRPSELVSMARAAGLAPQALKGIHYSPFVQRFTLSDDTDVNYLLACRRDRQG